MLLTDLLIIILAVWRITSIVYEEKIAEPIRRLMGYDGFSYPDTFLGNLFSCYYCLSVWIGIFSTVIWYYYPYLLYPFAFSAGAVILYDLGNTDNG